MWGNEWGVDASLSNTRSLRIKLWISLNNSLYIWNILRDFPICMVYVNCYWK